MGVRRVLESFAVRIPKVLLFVLFFLLSFFAFLFLRVRLWVRVIGLWLGLGFGFEPKRSNRETISQSFSDKVLLSYII